MRRLTLPTPTHSTGIIALVVLIALVIIIAVIYASYSAGGLLNLNPQTAENPAAASAGDEVVIVVAPIFSEEVPLSAAQALKAKASTLHIIEPVNPHLSLLEDNGAAVAASHAYTKPQGTQNNGTFMSPAQTSPFGSEPNMSVPDSLMNKLRTTDSSFVGIGLEGKAMVNGEVFSWSNVNLSNISYG